MAGQLNIKLLVASVHNLRVLLIVFDFILFSLYFKAKTQGIRACLIFIQETLLIVFYWT